MYPFAAEVPAAETSRSDVVEARVARKVAALFGVSGEVEPFRRSWVCDYTSLSLAELSRGAPHPSREERSRLEAVSARRMTGVDGAGWAWTGRAVWSPPVGLLPGALSNATMNRYGPDTKAAAVLSAANRLLKGPTAAVAAVGRHLAGTGCDSELRLAVWAGLVLEVYRAQPALVVAAIQGRQVQRSLSARWGAQVDWAMVIGPGAPCEIDAAQAHVGEADSGGRWRPTSFDLVDATLPSFGLTVHKSSGAAAVSTDTLDDIATAWCHRLLAVGRAGRGVVWLTEDGGGSRRAHCMVRVGAVVAPFVAASLRGVPAERPDLPPTLPALPPAGSLRDLPLLQRRAHLLAAHVAVNYLRYRDELLLAFPHLRAQTRSLVDHAANGYGAALDADDPTALLLQAYAAYLAVWDRPRSPDQDASVPKCVSAERMSAIAHLVSSQQRVESAWRSGRLDPGATAYLLEIGIAALQDPAAVQHDSAEGRPSQPVMQGWWSTILAARGLDPEVDLAAGVDSLSDAQVFHLHHYAAWLAGGRRRVDLRRALTMQQRVAAVRTRVLIHEPAAFASKSAAARAANELAAEIAIDLALCTPARERAARERALSAALRHSRAVLADPSTEMLRRAGPLMSTIRAAWVTTRAMSVVVAHRMGDVSGGATATGPHDTASSDDVSADIAAVLALLGSVLDVGHRHDGGPGRLHDASDNGHRPATEPCGPILAQLRVWRDELARLPGGGLDTPAAHGRRG